MTQRIKLKLANATLFIEQCVVIILQLYNYLVYIERPYFDHVEKK